MVYIDAVKEHSQDTDAIEISKNFLKVFNISGNLVLTTQSRESYNYIHNNLQTYPNDVFLVSYPKCGHHFIAKIMLEIMYHASKYDTKLDYYSKRPAFGMFKTVPRLPAIYKTDNNGNEIGINNFLNETHNLPFRFIKVHCMPNLSYKPTNINPKSKYVFLVRNPKDTFVSYYFFVKEVMRQLQVPNIKDDAQFEKEFISVSKLVQLFTSGIVPFGNYWDFYTNWYQFGNEYLNSDNILWIKYEDLININDRKKEIINIIQFLNCKNNEKLINDDKILDEIIMKTNFSSMKTAAMNGKEIILTRLKDKFFRKGKIGDWKNYMTNQESNFFDLITKCKFYQIQYLSDYICHTHINSRL